MSEYTPQSTDKLPSDTSPDTDRILYRGRLRVATTDYTLSGSYYYATKSVDMGQFKVTNMLNVDVWMADGTETYKAPMTLFSGTPPALFKNCTFFLQTGDKFSSTSLELVINVINTTGGAVDLYFQIKSAEVQGSLFPLIA